LIPDLLSPPIEAGCKGKALFWLSQHLAKINFSKTVLKLCGDQYKQVVREVPLLFKLFEARLLLENPIPVWRFGTAKLVVSSGIEKSCAEVFAC
jgi:hypothetical protein